MAQTLALFSLTNMLTKTELNLIPEKELKIATEIARKYDHPKITNFFSLMNLIGNIR